MSAKPKSSTHPGPKERMLRLAFLGSVGVLIAYSLYSIEINITPLEPSLKPTVYFGQSEFPACRTEIDGLVMWEDRLIYILGIWTAACDNQMREYQKGN